MNKRKIINDPVYGFINIPNEFIFDLIEHPYFQRLRNIYQLGLTYFVYPGATHSRFQHSLGAMYLMQNALDTLAEKDIAITAQEKEATLAAILLHDIGHSPFSHALEYFFVTDCSHEDITQFMLNDLNKLFKGRLDLTLEIAAGNYPKTFLHQLVSSQLDVDRLDYLNRDSFFTGVSEGVIGSERIIKMLNVHNNLLAADIKAVYSIEQFIIARRLMYWQVYLHKTVHVTEVILINILSRARELYRKNKLAFISPAVRYFFEKERFKDNFTENGQALQTYAALDDNDILFCIKMWKNEADSVLSFLSNCLYNRNLFKIETAEQAFDPAYIEKIKQCVSKQCAVSEQDSRYFVIDGIMENRAYNKKMEAIQILDKNGNPHALEDISDHLNHRTLSETVNKYFVCYPKNIFFD
jgi:HD superfamily phosphohydrolase